MPVSDYTPSLTDVGAITKARTRDNNGVEQGTFTTGTKATATDVGHLIDQAVGDVSTAIGEDIPTALFGEAKRAAAVRTAMLIELSHYPEQIAANRSAYPQWQEMWDGMIGSPNEPGRLVNAVNAEEAGGSAADAPGSRTPVWTKYPDWTDAIGMRTIL